MKSAFRYRPTVSVSLQLLAPEEAEETPCLAGISDPAIAAFSVGGSVQLPPIPEVPRESGRNSPTIGSPRPPAPRLRARPPPPADRRRRPPATIKKDVGKLFLWNADFKI